MRRSTAIGLFALLLLASALPALAVEIGVEGRSGNIHFPWTGLAPSGGAAPFPATNLFWGGAGWLALDLGEAAQFRVGYETDPVLRHLFGAQVLFERGIARVAVGPFIGAFNSPTALFSAGLSTTVRFQWPGIAFVSVRSDGGLAVGLLASAAASEPQALAELSAGFYAPNAIVSGTLTAKRFTETDAAGLLVIDALSRYMLQVDVYKKNVPYNLVASAGYQLRSKYYQASATTEALGSLLLGVKTTAQVAPGIKVSGDLSTGFFVFGLEGLAGRSPEMNSFMFAATLGVIIDTALLVPAPTRAKRSPTGQPVAPSAPATPAAPAPSLEAAAPAAETAPPAP